MRLPFVVSLVASVPDHTQVLVVTEKKNDDRNQERQGQECGEASIQSPIAKVRQSESRHRKKTSRSAFIECV